MFGLLRRKDPMEEARAVVDAYGAYLTAGRAAGSMTDERALPHPKATIRSALLLMICEDAFAERRQSLVNDLFTLATFQRLSAREEGFLLRKRLILAGAAADPARVDAAMFELELLEGEAAGLLHRLELAYEMDIERFERDLADLGFQTRGESAEGDPREDRRN